MIALFLMILSICIHEQHAAPYPQNDGDARSIYMAQQLLKNYESVLDSRPLTQGCKVVEILDVEKEVLGRGIHKVVAKFGCAAGNVTRTCTLKFIHDALRNTSNMTNAECVQNTSEESDS